VTRACGLAPAVARHRAHIAPPGGALCTRTPSPSFCAPQNKHHSCIRERTVAGTEPVKSFYANIGMGAFSRPCKVDPQARIVVYAPTSQLHTMPLPFLARFEKYRVSVDDLLTETLLALGEQDRQSGNPCDRAGLLRLVQAGCEHFVQWMDPASFYGLVDSITVAAYVLRAAKLTLENSARVPMVDLPLHVGIEGEGEGAADGDSAAEPGMPAPSGGTSMDQIK
jgi:hypothetical protein